MVISSKIKYAELDNVKIDILKIADTGQKIQKDALDRIPASTCISQKEDFVPKKPK